MVSKMYKREGIQGFYKGVVTETFNRCLYALFWIPTYQIMREKYGMPI